MKSDMLELCDNKWPIEDIVRGKVSDYYMVDKNVPLFFKLSDSKSLIHFIQSKLKSDSILNEVFSNNFDEIKKLEESKMWLKLEDESIISMNLLDVYYTFINGLKDEVYEDHLYNSYDISFVGAGGPFKAMSLINLLNEDIIQKVVFYSLVKNKLPLRNLRVHAQGKVLFRYGTGLDKVGKLDVRQITNTGVLFSSCQCELLQTLSSGDSLKVFINTEKIKDFSDRELKSDKKFSKDMFYTTDELRGFTIEEKKVVKSLSHRSGENNEFFIFCRFKDMTESEVPHVFSSFIDKAESYLKKLVA